MAKITDSRITPTQVFFWGGEFSNWFGSEFWYKGIKFYNSEQAFMWEKAIFFEDSITADKILATKSPKEAKALGRKVKGFDEESWTIASYPFMVAVNIAKFLCNPDLAALLLSTGDKMLVEASPYDKIWGIGMYHDNDECLDERNWKGMNLLGKALVEVRNTIISTQEIKLDLKDLTNHSTMETVVSVTSDLRQDIEHVLNKHSAENGSDTPDFILAEYLEDCLKAFDKAVSMRNKWYGPKTDA